MIKINFNRRSGFSFAELLIVLLIISAGFYFTVKIDIRSQTAEREADRLMRKIYNIFLRADYTGQKVTLTAEPRLNDYIIVLWRNPYKEEKVTATDGCYFKNLNSSGGHEMIYEPQWGTLTPAVQLEVTGTKGDKYYLIISGQGRIRISKTRVNS